MKKERVCPRCPRLGDLDVVVGKKEQCDDDDIVRCTQILGSAIHGFRWTRYRRGVGGVDVGGTGSGVTFFPGRRQSE